MKFDRQTKRVIRRWAPAVIGIAVMLLAAAWGSPTIRFFLFTHHWFWFISAMLLINPVSHTFWPSKEDKLARQMAGQARRHAAARKATAHRPSAAPTETAAQRLARLHKEKATVDEQIGRMTADTQEQVP